MSSKGSVPGVGFEATPVVRVEVEAAVLSAGDLIEAVSEEFKRQGDVPPSGERMLVVCRVVAGFLRTLPALPEPVQETQERIIAAFVSACPGWRPPCADYARVASLLDDVFHQREVAVPPPDAMDQLHSMTVAIMRRRGMPSSHAAQLAMADWIASLYLAGNDDW